MPVANGRADLSPSFEALNEKLWKKTGTAVASMRLELHDETGTRVADLDRDAAPLAQDPSHKSRATRTRPVTRGSHL
jgi:hypothetical protein